jgi:Poly(ADP-ribose) polymerase and DNA-Ligase Zn-finger region
MPHIIERASSSRSKCRACGEKITAGDQRLGERLPNPYDDGAGEMTHWFHVPCAAFRRPEAFLEALITTAETIAERDTLEHEAKLGVVHQRLPRVSTAERATSGRATCRSCRETIDKGAWRIALLYYEEGRFQPSGFIHVRCAATYLEATDIMTRVKRFSPLLGDAELAEIAAELAPGLRDSPEK